MFDAFYMTFITVATIGYAETVIPQQGQTPVPILLQRLVDDWPRRADTAPPDLSRDIKRGIRVRHCSELVMTCVLLAFAPAASLGHRSTAPVVMIWFADFQPPPSARAWSGQLEQVLCEQTAPLFVNGFSQPCAGPDPLGGCSRPARLIDPEHRVGTAHAAVAPVG